VGSEKDGSPLGLRGVARLCSGRRPPLGGRTRLVIIIIIIITVSALTTYAILTYSVFVRSAV